MPPTPQVFIGPAPTKQPTPTPVPPLHLTGQDVACGICEAADLVDPVMPDPATFGGPDIGDLIDQAYMWQQSVPYEGLVHHHNPFLSPLYVVRFWLLKHSKMGPPL